MNGHSTQEFQLIVPNLTKGDTFALQADISTVKIKQSPVQVPQSGRSYQGQFLGAEVFWISKGEEKGPQISRVIGMKMGEEDIVDVLDLCAVPFSSVKGTGAGIDQ